MTINIDDDILDQFLESHTLEAKLLDAKGEIVKTLTVRDWPPYLYLDTSEFNRIGFSAKKTEFQRGSASVEINKLGIITMSYYFCREII